MKASIMGGLIAGQIAAMTQRYGDTIVGPEDVLRIDVGFPTDSIIDVGPSNAQREHEEARAQAREARANYENPPTGMSRQERRWRERHGK